MPRKIAVEKDETHETNETNDTEMMKFLTNQIMKAYKI